MERLRELSEARVLVTGGAGFIGSHLVRALLRQGAEVRVLDNFSTGKRRNLAELLPAANIVEGSLTDPTCVARAVDGVDYVLHQGAIPSVPRSVDDPAASHAANVDGALTLLLAARDAGVRRLTYASSSSVYGDPPRLPVEECFPTNPLSPYAVQKLAAEQYCRVFARVYGLNTVCLRYFNVFGPGQDPASTYAAVIPRLISTALDGRPFVVHGDGSQSRDFTFVDNVVRANLLALVARNGSGRVFNVACGSSVSLNQIIAEIGGICGRELPVKYGPPRTGDVLHSRADISAAVDVLGYEPVVSVREGLRRTYDWFAGQRAERSERPSAPALHDSSSDEEDDLDDCASITGGAPARFAGR
jgi:UDP-glucose 4-epimerase